MVYLVYEYTLQKSRINATVTGIEMKNVLYAGTDKSTAVSIFDNALHDHYVISNNDKLELMLAAFNSNTEPGRLVTKLSQFMVGKTKAAPPPPADKDTLLKQIIENIHMAEYVYSLTHDGVNPLIKLTCADCGRALTTVLNKNITLSNESLCDICWSNYLTSDEGLAEYYLAIIMGKYSMSAFSREELLKIVASWEARRNTLVNTGRFTEEQLSGIETAAKAIGLDEESLQPPADLPDTPVTPEPEPEPEPDPIPVQLRVISPANKQHYLVGEYFNPDGMELIVIYDNGSSKILGPDDVIIADGNKALTADDSTIPIFYYDNGVEVTTEFSIEVSKVVKSISLYKEPDKLVYTAGEIFDPTGLRLKLSYSDGSWVIIMPEQCVIPDMPLSTGVLSVDIVYYVNDYKMSVSCPIEVHPDHSLTAIYIAKNPNRLTYTLDGDPFDPSGMEVKAFYADGTSADVYDVEFNVKHNEDNYYVLVSYTENGITRTARVDLDVRTEWLAQSMSIVQHPTTVSFNAGEPIDLSGLVVKVLYADTTTKTFTYRQIIESAEFTITANTPTYVENSLPAVSPVRQKIDITYTQLWAEEAVASLSVDLTVYLSTNYKVLSGLTVKPSDDQMYNVGEFFDPTGMVVTAHYKLYTSASTQKKVDVVLSSDAYTIKELGIPLTTEHNRIHITYTENYTTVEASQIIFVTDPSNIKPIG